MQKMDIKMDIYVPEYFALTSFRTRNTAKLISSSDSIFHKLFISMWFFFLTTAEIIWDSWIGLQVAYSKARPQIQRSGLLENRSLYIWFFDSISKASNSSLVHYALCTSISCPREQTF